MAIHRDVEEAARESVQECLDAAKTLLNTRKADNGVMGYAALVLLFCVVDAIGHHLDVGTGDTRLEALNEPRFGLPQEITDFISLKRWYRNPLLHNASIVSGVLITAHDDGPPVELGAPPIKIRVNELYRHVEAAWNTTKGEAGPFNPLRHTTTRTPPPMPTGPIFASSPPASGAGFPEIPFLQEGTGT
jgi:hypothetical protein